MLHSSPFDTTVIIWTVISFLAGSIPVAVLFGRLFLHVDPLTVGDHNPGGTNVGKLGGWQAGLAATALDMLKAYIPVFLAQRAGITEWGLVPVAIAPVIGHVIQPWLGFHGGKGLACTAGAWTALIPWIALAFGAGAVPAKILQNDDAYTALAGMLTLTAFASYGLHSPWLTALALINTALMFWTHRHVIGAPIPWKSWVTGNRRRA